MFFSLLVIWVWGGNRSVPQYAGEDNEFLQPRKRLQKKSHKKERLEETEYLEDASSKRRHMKHWAEKLKGIGSNEEATGLIRKSDSATKRINFLLVSGGRGASVKTTEEGFGVAEWNRKQAPRSTSQN